MVKQEVIIVNPKKCEQVKLKISEAGADNFHVVSDFDRTITYGLDEQGRTTTTVIAQLRSDVNYLGKDYFDESHRLFDIYHPIEINPNIPLNEKKKKMHEWWRKHFDLIAKSGLNIRLIKKVVRERPLKFRKGSLEFINFLKQRKIPLLFISAAPGDILIEYLKHDKLLSQNVHVVSNKYKFDKEGKAIEVQEPIIHVFNKSEISLKGYPAYNLIKQRENILILGDSEDDTEVVEGFDYDNLIKIGFLNENISKRLKAFKEKYDIILTGDQDFKFINKLVKELFR